MIEDGQVREGINAFAYEREAMEDPILAVVDIGSKESGLSHSTIWKTLQHPINDRSWAELMLMERDEALATIFPDDPKSIAKLDKLRKTVMKSLKSNDNWQAATWYWWKSVMVQSLDTAPTSTPPRQQEMIFDLVARNSLVSTQEQQTLWESDIEDYMRNIGQFGRKVNGVTSLIPDNSDMLKRTRTILGDIQRSAITVIQQGQIPILKMFDTAPYDRAQYWESLAVNNTFGVRSPQQRKRLSVDDVIKHTQTSLNSSFVSWSYASPMERST